MKGKGTKFLVVCGMIVLPYFSFAAYSQPVYSSSDSTFRPINSGGAHYIQKLGTGLTGMLDRIDVKFDFQNSGNTYWQVSIARCNSDQSSLANILSCPGYTYYLGGYQALDSGSQTYTGTFSPVISLDPTKYYFLLTSPGAGYMVKVLGSSSDNFGGSGNYCIYYESGSNVPCTNVSDIYFTTSVTSTSTRFISFTPTLGSQTENATSTNFTIGVTGYLSTEDFNEGDVELQVMVRGVTDRTLSQNLFGDGSWVYEIPSAGNFSWSTTTSILESGAYPVWFRLRRSRFPLIHIYKTYVEATGLFLVGSGSDVTQEQIDKASDFVDTANFYGAVTYGESGDATSTILGLGRAFSLRDAILGKFPINWVVESAVILQGLKERTSTTTFASISMDFSHLSTLQAVSTTTSQDWDIELFSPTIFGTIAAIPGIQTARTLEVWSLWIGLVFYAWKRGKGMFANRT